MTRRSCDGAGLLEAFRAAVANLEASVDEVNGLNVFPVPDGDTGNNMFATARAALDEAERAEALTVERVASAASFGALMGARGNSGVIASQILRGFSEALVGKRRINGLDLAHALREASRTAYGAVARPVEGTILTVIREAADAAVERAERSNDLEAVLGATVEAAEHAVAKTPSLLPILREAGVVDSGGQGLYRLLEGAWRHLRAGAPRAASATSVAATRPASAAAHPDEGFGYETMFLLQARPGEMLDLDRIRVGLEGLGESVLVAGDPRAAKIHVHGERPDRVIAFGLALGAISRISVENLDRQAHDVREQRALAFTGTDRLVAAPATAPELIAAVERTAARAGQPLADGPAPAAGGPAPVFTSAAVAVHGPEGRNGSGRGPAPMPAPSAGPAAANGATGRPPLGILAVAAGDGFVELFEQFRIPDQLAVRIVRGGQTNNPSTGELLEAIDELGAADILVLPNNPNVVLAAQQVAEMADRPVHVVATRNAAEGVAALLALDPAGGAAANLDPMTEAAHAIQSVQVTEAVRDARIGDRKVRKGQTIVLDPDDGLVAADSDRLRAILAGARAIGQGAELVTVYYGDGADLDEAEATARHLGEGLGGIEVQVVHGGQPFYRYLISAE